MEAIIEMAKHVGNSVFSYVDCHRKLEEDMSDLRSEFQVLKRRKIDVNSRIQAEVHWGQLVKEEVQGWLQDVQKIDDDMQVVEEMVCRVSYFSRACLPKLVRERIEVVKRIQERGSFFEGLSVDRAPASGIIIPTENVEDEISTKEKIWEHLMGDDVGMIGVYGIGGVGKTTIMKHVNNDLLKETKFHKVAWVTVSYPFNVFELQKNIAYAIGEKIPEDEEEMRRATALMSIMGKVRFVLILDDVWEKFSLKDVGIPEPTMQNGCKVVITSRSAEICNYLGCKIVKVCPLSHERSLNLFLNKVGRDVLQVPKLEEIVKLIVEECAGLPLAIVVIAGSMRGEYGINVWRNALNELQERVQSVNGSENEIFERLRFSYDRLNSSEIQKCFLYCSLFPEDFLFSKNSLIEGWIDEGLIYEFGSRQAAYDRGLAFLNKLEKNCMLEKTADCYGNDVVKLHDVLRDMAIKSIGPGLGYMAKAAMKLRKVPDELEWVKDLKKVSLMQNEISRIPLGLSPKCSSLSTLILLDNPLSKIPDTFFKDMGGLKVLDLSYTNTEALPESVSNLENLIALRLQSCKRLKHVPSLAKLSALKKFDLQEAGIALVPQGMDMLTSLTYLDLFCPHLKQIPTGILSNLSCLQYLVVYYCESNAIKIKGEEVARLSKLETLDGRFDNVQDFNYFVRSKAFHSLNAYMLVLGTDKDLISINFPTRSQCVLLISHCEIGGECIVLPSNLQSMRICWCKNLRTLNKIALLEKETMLSFCGIRFCEEIECMLDLVSSSSVCCPLLEKLESLDLYLLPSLHVLVRMEGVPTPPHIFSNLKMLFMRRCSRMRKLFPLELLPALQNLEKIEVGDCERMEELIASNASVKFTFPKLRELYLSDLPQLKSIYGVEGVMGCDSIEEIEILRCPKLIRIPIQFAVLDNGESSPPPSLTEIRIESYEWWESLKWDDPKGKNLLQPFLRHWQ